MQSFCVSINRGGVSVDDESIIGLYFERNEQAIAETSGKYSELCERIAMNILDDKSDAEEVLGDTWLRVWMVVPLERPKNFSVFLTVIVRNFALDRYRRRKTAKRPEAFTSVLDEAAELYPSDTDIAEQTERRAVIEAINRFLGTLPKKKRILFVRRYFYLDSIDEIVRRLGVTESYATVTLMRLRKKLRAQLEKEGLL